MAEIEEQINIIDKEIIKIETKIDEENDIEKIKILLEQKNNIINKKLKLITLL